MKIFVDTGAWKALYDKDDSLHELAVQTSHDLKEQRATFITSNFICDETITLLRVKTGHELASKFGDSLWGSRIINIVHVSPDIESQAWEIFKKYSDKSFSFTDCTSFATMQQLEINQAFTFDAHFRQFGFQILPSAEPLQTTKA